MATYTEAYISDLRERLKGHLLDMGIEPYDAEVERAKNERAMAEVESRLRPVRPMIGPLTERGARYEEAYFNATRNLLMAGIQQMPDRVIRDTLLTGKISISLIFLQKGEN